MTLPIEIRTALEADVEDMIYWSSLLNFFSSHQSELSLPQKIAIYEKVRPDEEILDAEIIQDYDGLEKGKTLLKKLANANCSFHEEKALLETLYHIREELGWNRKQKKSS